MEENDFLDKGVVNEMRKNAAQKRQREVVVSVSLPNVASLMHTSSPIDDASLLLFIILLHSQELTLSLV